MKLSSRIALVAVAAVVFSSIASANHSGARCLPVEAVSPTLMAHRRFRP